MVIDTHTLTWWLEEAPILSKQAAEVFRTTPETAGILRVSSVSFWEMRMKERRGHFLPKIPVSEWPAFLARVPWIEVADTDSNIWLSAAELDWSHRDPADRIIAATALAFGVPVLTKDRAFHAENSPVEAIW